MTSKLQSYCNEYGYTFPALPQSTLIVSRQRARIVGNRAAGNEVRLVWSLTMTMVKTVVPVDEVTAGLRNGQKKRYVPEINSGGYAILMALNIHDKHENGMTKSELVKHATQYCSTSFQANPATGNFYSAWASVNTLIKNEYVIAEGTPKYYFLTDLGRKLLMCLGKCMKRAKACLQVQQRPLSLLQLSQVKRAEEGLLSQVGRSPLLAEVLLGTITLVLGTTH